MLYRLQLSILNSKLIKRAFRKLRALSRRSSGADNYDQKLGMLVGTLASGKSFADIGCMWGINGHYCFVANESGATSVVGVDIMDATQEFLKRRDEQNSEIRFVKGDFHKASTQEEIGSCDVVLCSGVFYHVPDPVATLRALRKICSETLILGTAIIPEMEVKNAAVLYPYLDSKERRLWDRHIGIQVGISGPYEPKAGYENWFWGLTPSAVSSLLKIAGFEVVKQSITTFDGLFICRAVESETIMGDHAPKSSPLSENFMTGRAGDKRGRRLWIDQKDFAQKDNA